MPLPPDSRIFVPTLPDDIRIVFEDRSDYLYALVSGPRDSMDIAYAYWELVAAECARRGTSKVMVVENLGDHEGERDMAGMIDALMALGLGRLKVAFVAARIDILARMEHYEILALERGANGRVFANTTVAERWLRHGGQ
jgi:hypothetical protein